MLISPEGVKPPGIKIFPPMTAAETSVTGIGFNSTGEIRKNSYSVAIGILIFLVGNGINAGDLTTAIEIFFILAPIAMMIGLVMLQIGLK